MKKNRQKVWVIVLALLLCVCLLALGGVWLYRSLLPASDGSATVSDNVITPEKEPSSAPANAPASSPEEKPAGSSTEPIGETAAKKEDALSLYRRHEEANRPFRAENLFPGDTETRLYSVRVSYHDTVTVRFHADIRPGSEKLAEVLRVRVALGEETLYDGLMRDMPESLNRTLSSEQTAVEILDYEITAYLETSVGNDYMDRELTADFRWWVEESGNLDPSPSTSDRIPLYAAFGAAAAACGGGVLLIVRRRRKEEEK